jgi:hypothetical protein
MRQKFIIMAGMLCFALVVFVFVKLWTVDDGWFMMIGNKLVHTGSVRYFFSNGNAEAPFLRLWAYVLGFVGSACGFSPRAYFIYRIPNLVLSLLALFVLDKTLRHISVSAGCRALGLGLMTLWFCVAAAGISCRPDVCYVFAITMSILAHVRFSQGDKKLLYVSMLLNALAASIHPNGMVGFMVNAITVVMERKALRTRDVVGILICGCVSLLVLVKILAWNGSVAHFLSVLESDQADPAHSLPFYKEYIRVAALLVYDTPVVPFFALALVPLFSRRTPQKNFLRACVLGALAYLVLFPSKWDHYYSILVPALSMLLALFAQSFEQEKRKVLAAVLSGCLACFLLIAAVNDSVNSVLFQSLLLHTKWVRAAQSLQSATRGKVVSASPVFYPYLVQAHMPGADERGISPDYKITYYDEMPQPGMRFAQTIRFEGKYFNVYAHVNENEK